jgi:hypothetical protein
LPDTRYQLAELLTIRHILGAGAILELRRFVIFGKVASELQNLSTGPLQRTGICDTLRVIDSVPASFRVPDQLLALP